MLYAVCQLLYLVNGVSLGEVITATLLEPLQMLFGALLPAAMDAGGP